MQYAVRGSPSHQGRRAGFNLVEMLIALAITSMLLTATMVALHASFMAYQTTTEEASTHVIARLIQHRIMAAARIAQEFGPVPENPHDEMRIADNVYMLMPDGQWIGYTFDDDTGILYFDEFPGNDPENEVPTHHELLRGIDNPLDTEDLVDDDGEPDDPQPPFAMEYRLGRDLQRLCVHLEITPDDVQHMDIEGDSDARLPLDFCVMPRMESYDN